MRMFQLWKSSLIGGNPKIRNVQNPGDTVFCNSGCLLFPVNFRMRCLSSFYAPKECPSCLMGLVASQGSGSIKHLLRTPKTKLFMARSKLLQAGCYVIPIGLRPNLLSCFCAWCISESCPTH